jgi:Domain of unknown function (DUF3943)
MRMSRMLVRTLSALVALAGLAGALFSQAPAGPPARQRHTGRAIAESAAILGASTVYYWTLYADFMADWQFNFTWRDQKRRFFTAESPKFDSNSFGVNWGHALAGAYFYSTGRTNGLSSRTSALFSLGVSTVWEVACEWREIISINDLIFTSLSGPAIGEPLFQAGSYFTYRKGFWNGLAGFLFNPPLAINNWFDRSAGPAANSGPEAGWHRFSLFAGMERAAVSPAGTTTVPASAAGHEQFNLGLEAETNAVLGYGQPGELRAALSDTLSSRIFFDMSFSPAGLEEFRLRTQAVLFGRAWQSLDGEPGAAVRGTSVSLGYATAFEAYRKRPVAWYDSGAEQPGDGPALSYARFARPTPTEFTDKMVVVSPLGGALEAAWFGPGFHVRWRSGAYGDFAMVNALAYNSYTEGHDPSGVKSTLLNWGYYYAWGMTLVTDGALDWRSWRLRAGLGYQFYGSIQGLDRYQFLGVVTDDFGIRDDRLTWFFRLGCRLPGTPLELGLSAEGTRRSGRILDLAGTYRETRLFYRLSFVF